MSENGTKLTGLSSEAIAALLQNRRTRNAYDAPFEDFVNSDEAAISVKDNYPLLAGKKATTLYQGFRTVREKLNMVEIVDVVQQGNDVFLFHNERLAAIGMAVPEPTEA
jgi:hypothetical protein